MHESWKKLTAAEKKQYKTIAQQKWNMFRSQAKSCESELPYQQSTVAQELMKSAMEEVDVYNLSKGVFEFHN